MSHLMRKETLVFLQTYDKTNKMTKPTKWLWARAKTQISLGIRPVWSESSLSAWRKFGSLATHWAHCEDSDQTGRMPRLIWVFAVRTCTFVGFVMRWLLCTGISQCHISSFLSEASTTCSSFYFESKQGLAWAFTVRICDKFHLHMSRLKWFYGFCSGKSSLILNIGTTGLGRQWRPRSNCS